MNASHKVHTLSVFLLLCLCAPLQASETYNKNWPNWRGPAGNGLVLHGNPPTEWSEDKNIKWKVAIPGKGHATPIIWESKIFILTAVPNPKQAFTSPNVFGQAESRGERRRRRGGGRRRTPPTEEYSFIVMCLDRATGKTLWQKTVRKKVPHQGIQSSNTYSSGSPVTDGEHVWSYFGSQGLYCHNMNGDLVWEKDLGEVSVTFGEASSPTLYKDKLFALQDNNGDSFLYAFDKKTGKEIWKIERNEDSGWTTPYILHHNGKAQLVVNGSNAVRSYDPDTGKLIWQCSGLGSNPVPVIVSDAKNVYAFSGHREPNALAIELGHTGDLTDTKAVKWTTDRGTPYVPSPLLYDGLLFFCQRTSAMLSCVDAATGKPHFAQERIDGISGVYSSPIGINNHIYLAGQNGTTVILAKDKELKVVATNKLDDGFDASPAVVDNELYLRGRKNLYCITE